MSFYAIELEKITKKFGKFLALNNINLKIRKAEFFTLLGPSGSGKTTILRTIIGFENPDNGNIIIRGEIVNHKSPHERNIGMVFQNYALFPHLTVFENIAFPLVIRKEKYEKIRERVASVLDLVSLKKHKKKYPKQLSGGEQQRVAIARALVFNPAIILLDEPFSALDSQLRNRLRMEIKKIQKDLKITMVYVTHDREEAFALSDRIGVIKSGVIEQIGTPEELYKKPKNLFIAKFVGDINILEGVVVSVGSDHIMAISSGMKFKILSESINFNQKQNIYIGIRPEAISVSNCRDNCFSGKVVESLFVGNMRKIIVNVNENLIKIYIAETINFNIGDNLLISFYSRDCMILN